MALKVLQMRLKSFDSLIQLSTSQYLLLQACLATSKEARETAVRAWEQEIVFDELDFSSSRLLPYFYHHNQLDGINTIHDNRIKNIYKHWWLRGQHITHQLKAIINAFEDAGIAVVVIKGASIKLHYDTDVLRPMADFDLLVGRNDLLRALQIIEGLGFEPNAMAQDQLKTNASLFLDFKHAIPCIHKKNATEIDLHWQVGTRSSRLFVEKLWQHVDDYTLIPFAKKPPLAYEVFMLIIHAVDAGSGNNLNWIIDIAVINAKEDKSFWHDARNMAVAEKKADLFDYGCAILLQLGVYAPSPDTVKKPRTLLNTSDAQWKQKTAVKLLFYKVYNLFIIIDRIYPHANVFMKGYQLIRCTYFYFIARRTSRFVE